MAKIPKTVSKLEKSFEQLSLQAAAEKQRLESEIQVLKQQYENDSPFDTARALTFFNFRHLEDMIPKFTRNYVLYSVGKWTQDKEDNSQMFNWTELQTLITVRKLLSGIAELWLKSETTFKM